jgi:2-polyprenyl-6-methoxyphenol hydroxylase-like FAD-dependent oxidoreductase
MQVFHHRAGLVLEASLAGLGMRHPYLVLPHPEIERVLADAARATGRVEVRYSCRVTRLVEEAGRVRGVGLENCQDGEHVARARLIIGADGSTSMVRDALGIPLPRQAYDHCYFGIEVERPADYQDAMRIELHPAGGILVVPNPSMDRVGLGVLVHRRDEGLFRASSVGAKLAEIQRRSPLFAGCAAFSRGSHLYKLSRAHAPRYAARGVALLGDAIHVTNPTAGQGMTMAIEDAAALARHVGSALCNGEKDARLDAQLRCYERERRPLNAALIRWSHVMSFFYALDVPLSDWLRRRTFALGNTSLGRWIQRRIWSSVASRNGD